MIRDPKQDGVGPLWQRGLTPCVRVLVAGVEGSAPREAGAAMLVWAGGFEGTIGGGTLEHQAIRHALELLARDHLAPWHRELRSYALGPTLGQCCGGMVRLAFEMLAPPTATPRPTPPRHEGREPAEPAAPMEFEMPHRPRRPLPIEAGGTASGWGGQAPAPGLIIRPIAPGIPPVHVRDRTHTADWPLPVLRAVRQMLAGERTRETLLIAGRGGGPEWLIEPELRTPHALYLYGAGHVGRAVVRVLTDLPFAIVWVDIGAERFPATIPANAAPLVSPDPAGIAARAPPGALHLVMTYSHALDLAICRAVLARDFAWAGLIGSTTKRARFEKRLRESGIGDTAIGELHCPIGIGAITGKEPAMIAVSVAAQLAAWASLSAAAIRLGGQHHG